MTDTTVAGTAAPTDPAPGPATAPSRAYTVVVNHEEQYSLWPADQPLPAGWSGTGFTGPHADCLARIDQVWTDMRPLSLRTALGGR
jgi:MbtH protein